MLKTEEAWLYGFSADLPPSLGGHRQEHKHTEEWNQDLIKCELHHWEDLLTAETRNLDRKRIAKGHSRKTTAKQTSGHRPGNLSLVTIHDWPGCLGHRPWQCCRSQCWLQESVADPLGPAATYTGIQSVTACFCTVHYPLWLHLPDYSPVLGSLGDTSSTVHFHILHNRT